MWDTWVEFLIPGFTLALSLFHCPILSPTLFSFQINKSKGGREERREREERTKTASVVQVLIGYAHRHMCQFMIE